MTDRSSRPLRVLIVDDESWARRRLTALLRGGGNVDIVAECSDGGQAVEAIRTLSLDLVFLDVQMPELDGFEVLQTVGPDDMPLVVFATAHDEYAVRAFEAHALDYLLKPFDEERLRRVVDRAREELAKRHDPTERLEALVRSLRLDRHYLQRLVVKARGRVLFVKVSDVDWFEAAGNYVTAHIGVAQHLIRETVSALEGKLDPEQFVRIHRSTIVNLERVRELSAWSRGEQLLALKDGITLHVGRAFRTRLQRFVDNALE
jgi:two-component system LytT family response regulator